MSSVCSIVSVWEWVEFEERVKGGNFEKMGFGKTMI